MVRKLTRLSAEEKVAHQIWLTEWRAPVDMLDYVGRLMSRIGSVALFNQAGIDFILEAQAAAEFAHLRGATRVRLISDEWPDFAMERVGRVEYFEITEADLPGRKRGREYREATKTLQSDPVWEWIKRADQVPVAMSLAAARKVNKLYSGKAHLLIYLNISEYGVRQREIEERFRSATEIAKDRFESIWVLWKNRAYQIWSDGKLVC